MRRLPQPSHTSSAPTFATKLTATTSDAAARARPRWLRHCRHHGSAARCCCCHAFRFTCAVCAVGQHPFARWHTSRHRID
eukprot:5439734-Prymnesium_polylepis.1